MNELKMCINAYEMMNEMDHCDFDDKKPKTERPLTTAHSSRFVMPFRFFLNKVLKFQLYPIRYVTFAVVCNILYYKSQKLNLNIINICIC